MSKLSRMPFAVACSKADDTSVFLALSWVGMVKGRLGSSAAERLPDPYRNVYLDAYVEAWKGVE